MLVFPVSISTDKINIREDIMEIFENSKKIQNIVYSVSENTFSLVCFNLHSITIQKENS